MRRRHVGHDAVADLLRLRIRRQGHELLARPVVPGGDARGGGHHVHRLRERDRRDERQRRDAVHPPVTEVSRRGGLAVDPDCDQPLPDDPPDRRPLLERRIGLGDPQRLEEEPCHSQEQQGADEDPVADLVVPARIAARDAVDTGVVETLRLAGALHTQDHEADDEEGAEDVEEQRVAEIERPLPEVPPEDRLGEVVLEREDPRADEEHDEAVEDHRVCKPGDAVPALDPGVGEHDPGGPACTVQRPVGREAAPPSPVLDHEPADAPREDRRRDDDQRVPERDLPGGQAGEGLARLHPSIPRPERFHGKLVGDRRKPVPGAIGCATDRWGTQTCRLRRTH